MFIGNVSVYFLLSIFLSILIDGSLPTTSTEVQNKGVVELTSLNLDAMEQSLGLKDTIITQLCDVFHV